MPLYLIKPVVWNDQGYQRPAGGKFRSGYPKENGFGHEEWNNSPRLDSKHAGEEVHIFHTEGFGNQDLDAYAGAIFVFMVASFGGRQYLVAVAGNSTAYFGKRNKSRRLELLNSIPSAKEFREEAWAVGSVRKAFGGDRRTFDARWKSERHWFATWYCPADLYLGLEHPVQLEPLTITGKNRLITMYGSYQEVDRPTAARIISLIPDGKSAHKVRELRRLLQTGDAEIAHDLLRLQNEGAHSETTRRTLIDARLGQGKFREQLSLAWEARCAVTGCSVSELLRASHIKPWRASSNRERLDPDNGILLAAHLDALFDAGLITFADDGQLMTSDILLNDADPQLVLGSKLRKEPSSQMRSYLEHHRKYVFQISKSVEP